MEDNLDPSLKQYAADSFLPHLNSVENLSTLFDLCLSLITVGKHDATEEHPTVILVWAGKFAYSLHNENYRQIINCTFNALLNFLQYHVLKK